MLVAPVPWRALAATLDVASPARCDLLTFDTQREYTRRVRETDLWSVEHWLLSLILRSQTSGEKERPVHKPCTSLHPGHRAENLTEA